MVLVYQSEKSIANKLCESKYQNGRQVMAYDKISFLKCKKTNNACDHFNFLL